MSACKTRYGTNIAFAIVYTYAVYRTFTQSHQPRSLRTTTANQALYTQELPNYLSHYLSPPQDYPQRSCLFSMAQKKALAKLNLVKQCTYLYINLITTDKICAMREAPYIFLVCLITRELLLKDITIAAAKEMVAGI